MATKLRSNYMIALRRNGCRPTHGKPARDARLARVTDGWILRVVRPNLAVESVRVCDKFVARVKLFLLKQYPGAEIVSQRQFKYELRD